MNFFTRIIFILFITITALFSLATSSNATLVRETFDVLIIQAFDGNPVDVETFDFYSGWTLYDDSMLTGVGEEILYIGEPDSGYELGIQVGNRLFMEFEDVDYDGDPDKFPSLLFKDGDLVAIDSFYVEFGTENVFWATNSTHPVYGDIFPYFTIDDTVLGQFNFHNNPSPIPEPATMLLFGSGLIGLTGIRKKIRKK